MIELGSPRADQPADGGADRHQLDFGLGLLGVIVERRLDAVDAVVAQADLVVAVLDRAEPEADHVDGRGVRAEFAAAGVAHLLELDARVGRCAIQRGHVIERGEARDRGADIAAVEQIGAADRLPLGVHG